MYMKKNDLYVNDWHLRNERGWSNLMINRFLGSYKCRTWNFGYRGIRKGYFRYYYEPEVVFRAEISDEFNNHWSRYKNDPPPLGLGLIPWQGAAV